ncbi:hypothetical protein HNV12_01490 [Methanococcoides sp. SA1]|nr:hypothetical protein [Methanococcoides sp. SA1]
MKTKGSTGILKTITKAILITLLIILIQQVYAKEITPKIITTTFPEVDPTTLEQVERFYEISQRSLETGYNVTLDTPSAFQTKINNKNRYIIASNFLENSINLIFIGTDKNVFNKKLNYKDYVIFKIEDLNLQFILHSSNSTHAQIELKLFRQTIPEDADYFELFDIKVRLIDKEIYSPNELTAITEFTNFGEGPSKVRIIYSITNLQGKEFHTAIDEKIIETDEVIIKKFSTLNIPNNQYTLTTTIYYGDNQEATSQDSFTLKSVPKTTILKQPTLFIGIIIASFLAVLYFKRKKKEISLNQ